MSLSRNMAVRCQAALVNPTMQPLAGLRNDFRLQSRLFTTSLPRRSPIWFSQNRYSINRSITWTFFGMCTGVFVAWNFSEKGVTYSIYESIRPSLQLPRIDPTKLRRKLLANFMLTPGMKDNFAYFGAAISHIEPLHYVFNMVAITSLTHPLCATLPPIHYLTLIAGSALASSAAWQYIESRKSTSRRQAGLGASGIGTSVLANLAFFAPTSKVQLFLFFPMPIWLCAGGLAAWDFYEVWNGGDTQLGSQTVLGHSAHLGGTLFGCVYYALVLRRFGGILAPRRI